jgi:hypothetical protein
MGGERSVSELAVFRAELDRLEAEDRWDDPAYDFLAQRVEELKAASKSTPSAPQSTPTTGQPEPDLAARMLAMQANPERFSDEQVHAIVAEYNREVLAAGQTDQPERIDVAALAREMATASADPSIDPEQARELGRRYNLAIRQGVGYRTTETLRADLASPDLTVRMEAASALQDRGELSDDEVAAATAAYHQAVAETSVVLEATAGIDIAGLPEELRPAAEAIVAAKKSLEVPPDPVDAALHQFNQAVRSMKAPSLEQQLAELGLDPDPDLGAQAEPQPQPASQEA